MPPASSQIDAGGSIFKTRPSLGYATPHPLIFSKVPSTKAALTLPVLETPLWALLLSAAFGPIRQTLFCGSAASTPLCRL